MRVEPKDPTELDFFDVAKSHLESKYPDVIESWEELKRVTSEHNKELALLFEKMRTLVTQELKLPCHYSSLRGRTPQERITVDRFIESIYQEMKFRQVSSEKWHFGKPKIEPFISGDKKFYGLGWANWGTLVVSLDQDIVKKAMVLIDKIVENSEFREVVRNVQRNEDEICKGKRESFEAKLKDVIKSIELGKILEGKCRFCSSMSF